MFHLILTVMSIALMAMVATASVTYLNPSAVRVAEWQERLETTFLHLDEGYKAYRRAGTTMVRQNDYNADGDLIGFWYNEVFSPTAPIEHFVKPPYMPTGTSWDFSTQDGGTYFCMHGDFSTEPAKAASNLIDLFGSSYVVNDSCGAKSSSEPSSTSSMAVTFWVHPYDS
ncbi:hypothetical protein [Vreelandella massiliensis]|uniref:hypothetical protein n=1 Tax=Vreelandella massiliensis TaxID=1816686 RepID=UPI00096A3399|nr:hypothetical protein [Halomonas massiliensis]